MKNGKNNSIKYYLQYHIKIEYQKQFNLLIKNSDSNELKNFIANNEIYDILLISLIG
jgi:hypothetical protein